MIAYFIVFVIFSWDKIYYIVIKKGNDTNTYFLIKHYEKCIIHNSYKCGCILKEKFRDQSSIINKYLKFYKYCTEFYDIGDNKIKKFKINDIINIIQS